MHASRSRVPWGETFDGDARKELTRTGGRVISRKDSSSLRRPVAEEVSATTDDATAGVGRGGIGRVGIGRGTAYRSMVGARLPTCERKPCHDVVPPSEARVRVVASDYPSDARDNGHRMHATAFQDRKNLDVSDRDAQPTQVQVADTPASTGARLPPLPGSAR